MLPKYVLNLGYNASFWNQGASSFFVWNGQRQNCKAAIGLSIRVEMIGGGRPLLRENLAEARPPPCKTPRALQRLYWGRVSRQNFGLFDPWKFGGGAKCLSKFFVPDLVAKHVYTFNIIIVVPFSLWVPWQQQHLYFLAYWHNLSFIFHSFYLSNPRSYTNDSLHFLFRAFSALGYLNVTFCQCHSLRKTTDTAPV